MARRRKQTPETDTVEMAVFPSPVVPPVDTLPPMTALEARRDEELESILDEIGSESRIKVWQVSDGKSSYAGEMSGAEFSLETLLDTFGGGDKTLAIYQGRQRMTTVKVSLDPTVPPKNPRLKLMTGAPAASGSGDVNGILTAIAASQLQSANTMTQMMTGMVTAMVSVLGATKPVKDPMEIALEMAKVMKGESGGASPADFLSALKQGMEIGERIGGSGGDDDGVMSAVNKGLDTLGVIVSGIVQNKQNQHPALSAPAVPALPPGPSVNVGDGAVFLETPHGPPTPPTEAPPVTGTIRPWVAAAYPYIGQLFAAASFLPPSAAAETISKRLDDEQFSDLMDDISDETNGGFAARLGQYFPHAVGAINPEWFGEVLQILVNEYAADDDDAPPPLPGVS